MWRRWRNRHDDHPRSDHQGGPHDHPHETTRPALPAAVPDTIDVAYVQQVIDVLDHLLGETFRAVKAKGAVDEEFQARMRAIYTPDSAPTQIDGFEKAVGIDGLADPPLDPVSQVREVRSASASCVFFAADRDLAPLVVKLPEEPVQPYYVSLERQEPTSLNPTPWAIASAQSYRAGQPLGDLCAG